MEGAVEETVPGHPVTYLTKRRDGWEEDLKAVVFHLQRLRGSIKRGEGRMYFNDIEQEIGFHLHEENMELPHSRTTAEMEARDEVFYRMVRSDFRQWGLDDSPTTKSSWTKRMAERYQNRPGCSSLT